VPGTTVVDVAFPFIAEIIAPKRRNPERGAFSERTSVTIAESGREEFVPAVRLTRSELSYLASKAGREDPERMLYGYRGALWAPVLDSEFSLVAPDVLTSILKQTPEGLGLRYGSPFWFGGQVDVEADGFEAYVPHKEFGFKPKVEPYNSVQVRKLVSSNFETRQADAQRVADSMRVVDGKLWFRCQDPVWVGRRSDPAVTLVFGPPAEHLENEPWERQGESFRADRLEEMKDWRRRYRRSFSKSFAEISDVMGAVEVLDGSFFRRDDLKALTEGVDRVADAAHAFMFKAPKSAVLDWAAFRESASALSRSWTRAGAEKALEDMTKVARFVSPGMQVSPQWSESAWTMFRTQWNNHCQRIRVRAKWFENAMQPTQELSADDLSALEEMAAPTVG
jgi:hypothetical protein